MEKWYIINNDYVGNEKAERKVLAMNKFDEVLDRVNEVLGRKEEEEKKTNTILWVFAIIGAVAAIAAIAYAAYRYFKPDYLEDFEDDFEDDFDDDFFDDDDEEFTGDGDSEGIKVQ